MSLQAVTGMVSGHMGNAVILCYACSALPT